MIDSISPVFGKPNDTSEQSDISFILDKPILIDSINSSQITSQDEYEEEENKRIENDNYLKPEMGDNSETNAEIYLSQSMPPEVQKQENANTPENKLKNLATPGRS